MAERRGAGDSSGTPAQEVPSKHGGTEDVAGIGGIIEDAGVDADSGKSITENVPAAGLKAGFQLASIEHRRESTRNWIVYALLAILALLVLVGCIGWLMYGADTSRMQNFSVLFSPVVTLLAGMLGFYFSSEKK